MTTALLLGLLLMRNIVDSRMGRAMRAVRDNDTAAAVYGINLTQVKVLTFGISAAFAGAAGAMEVTMFPFVSQDNFDFTRSLNLYAAAVIGGLGSLWGAVLGTSALSLVPKVGGDAQEDIGSWLNVSVRGQDGRWKISRSIWNSDLPLD